MTHSTRTLETLEIVGGALCLDFANTINSRLQPEHDYLLQYSDLVGWANKVGILSVAEMNRLQKESKQKIDEAEIVLQTASLLRELLYGVFATTAKGSEPNNKDMQTLVTLYGDAISHGQLIKTDHHFSTAWKLDEGLGAVLWPIIHSAGELLQSEELQQVKECPGCGWLFLDTSKNQSRRWCSMYTCGVRDKMRRYHKRQHAK